MDKSTFVNLIRVTLFCIALPAISQAETVLSAPYFENAVKAYSNLKSDYQHQRDANQLAYENEIAPGQAEVEQLKKEIQSCTTFDCAKTKQARIDEIETLKSASARKYADVGTELYRSYVASGNDLALVALSSELQATTLGNPKFTNVSFAADSKCESQSHNLEYMMCRQINVEFKYDGHFYKVATAIGLLFGKEQCSVSSTHWDAAKLDKIFGSTRDQFMLGVNPNWFFLQDATFSMGREKGSDIGNYCSGFDYMIWGSDDPEKGLIGFHVVRKQAI